MCIRDRHESGLESVVPIAEAKILFQRKLEELKAPVIYVEGEEKGFSFWRSELMGNDIDLCVSYLSLIHIFCTFPYFRCRYGRGNDQLYTAECIVPGSNFRIVPGK